jgi:hypothetical protein
VRLHDYVLDSVVDDMIADSESLCDPLDGKLFGSFQYRRSE